MWTGYLIDFRRTFLLLPEGKQAVRIAAGVPVTPLDSVLAEATAAVQSAPGPLATPIDLVGEFRRNPSPAMKALFAAFRSHPSEALRLAEMRVRVLDGDIADLEGTLAAAPDRGAARLLADIRERFANPDPAAVRHLARALTSATAPQELRLACAAALARVHTREAVPYLAKLLDDPDGRIRAAGVGGLAQFANNVPIGSHHPSPGVWKYRTKETLRNSAMDEALLRERPEILAFWKGWWQRNRAEF